MARLSTKDKEKPFILIGAVIAGIIIQRLIGKELPSLIYLTEIGVFFVIFVVMLPVEIKDVGNAFKKKDKTHGHSLIRQFHLYSRLFMDNGMVDTQKLSRLLGRCNPLYPHSLHWMVSHIHRYRKGRCAVGNSPSSMEHNPSGAPYAALFIHPCRQGNPCGYLRAYL